MHTNRITQSNCILFFQQRSLAPQNQGALGFSSLENHTRPAAGLLTSSSDGDEASQVVALPLGGMARSLADR